MPLLLTRVCRISLFLLLTALVLLPAAGAMDFLGPEPFNAVPPPSWIQFDVGGVGNLWATNSAFPSPVSGGAAAFFDDFNGANEVWLISPSMNLSSATAPSLVYWERVNFAGYATVHEVLYSTDYTGAGDPTGSTWTTLNTAIGPEDTWVEQNFDLSAAAGQSSVYIAFRYAGNFASEWWIDDVLVFEPQPFAVQVTGPGPGNQSVGTSIDHTFRITNSGTSADTYDLVGSGAFFTGLSASTATLAAGAFVDVQATAVLPCMIGPAAPLTVTATSQTMGSVTDDHSFTITPSPDVNSGSSDGYFFANSIAGCAPSQPIFGWVDISGTGTDVTGSLTDDNFIGPFPIGFTFTFFGNDYTQFYISSNGWISFDSADPGGLANRTNTTLPDAAAPNDLIALFWDDLNPTDPDAGGTQVIYGNGPGGELVVTFERMPEFGADADGWITAQILLLPNGNIRIQNDDHGPSIDLIGATVGIENSDGSLGVQYHLNGAGGPLFSSPLAIEFGTDPGALPVELQSFEID